jgi:hypothetical protein
MFGKKDKKEKKERGGGESESKEESTVHVQCVTGAMPD